MSMSVPRVLENEWNHPATPHPSAPATVDAVLEGGPLDLPTALRQRMAKPTDLKFKVPHRGGYEHFERLDQAAAGAPGRTLDQDG
jgi:Family of unknown function (DUF5988)